ncbi:MAG: hypothetical protein ACTINN_14195 [Brachybacterium tyrofermentans]
MNTLEGWPSVSVTPTPLDTPAVVFTFSGTSATESGAENALARWLSEALAPMRKRFPQAAFSAVDTPVLVLPSWVETNTCTPTNRISSAIFWMNVATMSLNPLVASASTRIGWSFGRAFGTRSGVMRPVYSSAISTIGRNEGSSVMENQLLIPRRLRTAARRLPSA